MQVTSLVKPVRVVDESYLDFIRNEPCLVHGTACRQTGLRDPHHLAGRGSRGTDPIIGGSDHTAVPLCRRLHDDLENRLSVEVFNHIYAVDLWREAFRLFYRYLGIRGRVPAGGIRE